jgi:hypothetical protein
VEGLQFGAGLTNAMNLSVPGWIVFPNDLVVASSNDFFCVDIDNDGCTGKK